MSYMHKFVGKYRVIADYDLKTLDYPRDYDGTLDSSFDDLYIPCAYERQIRHGTGTTMWAYIPHKTRATNIMKKIWKDNFPNKDIPHKQSDTYYDEMCSTLVASGVLRDAEILDDEGYFMFDVKEMDYFAKLLGAKTNGKKIAPFSTKNLPKDSYKIPESDMKKYRDIVDTYPKIERFGRMIPNGLIINAVTKDFMTKNKIVNDTRKPNKEYIHSVGLWDKYLEHLREKNDVC